MCCLPDEVDTACRRRADRVFRNQAELEPCVDAETPLASGVCETRLVGPSGAVASLCRSCCL